MMVVVGGLSAAAGLTLWQVAPLVAASAGTAAAPGADPARALVAWVVLLCAAMAGAWWFWLLGSTIATSLAAVRGVGSLPRCLLAPRVLRTALGLVVGTTTVGTLVMNAPGAVASPAEGHHRPGPVLPGALVGLPLPDRVTGAGPRVRLPRPAASTRATRVRTGDSLWSIAADRVGRPTTARVARTWPRLYAANRAVIGPDPDLIRPGTRLVVPASLRRHHQPPRGESR